MGMEIQKSVGPLRKLCYFMNLETDLETRMKLNRARRQLGNERRLEARQKRASVAKTDTGEEVFAVDIVPIEVKDLTFGFEGVACLSDFNASFAQGLLYAFVGPAH